MTKQEREAQKVAKKLLGAFMALENYLGDVADIFDDAKVQLCGFLDECL